MALSKEDDKHEKIIRALLRLPGNRRCINCGSLGPQYVCTNFSTFICTLCSGIHREFLHRIKSVSMAKFSAAEISELQSGGNDQARKVFLKAWNSDRNTFPDNSNPDKIREFIKSVYVQRRFTAEKPFQESQQNVETRVPRQNYAQAGGLAYGNRNFVRTVLVKRDNGDVDRSSLEDSAEPDEDNTPESPPNPSKIASGSKRETVIRQLLQPPVEKRKNQQLQRNYSSGSIGSDQTSRRPQVQRSNSTSLKDLMVDDPQPKPATPPTKSKSLIDLTEPKKVQQPQQQQRQQQQQQPISKISPLTTKSISTPCLIDLISGDDASRKTSNTPSKVPQAGYAGKDLIDLLSDDSGSGSNSSQADPFATTTTTKSFDLDNATREDRVPGPPVLPQTSTVYTSFPGGPDLSRSMGDFVVPGPSPATLPASSNTGFLAAPPQASFFQGPVQDTRLMGIVGTIQNSMSANPGYYSQTSMTGNPFDMMPLAKSVYTMQPPPMNYYPGPQGVYNYESPMTMQAPPVFQQQPQQQYYPTSSSSSSRNPFA